MSKYDSLIFDLDGTIWDATRTTAKGWIAALTKFEVPIPNVTQDDISQVAGLVYEDCVRTLLKDVPVPMDTLLPALKKYEKHFMMEEGGVLYDQVRETLEALALKYPLYIVSNCQDWYLDAFFNTTNLKSYFKDYETNGRTGKPKAHNIKDLIERNHLKNPVYIGDTEGDRDAAQEAGVDFIFCSYGFGKFEAEHSVSSFTELAKLL